MSTINEHTGDFLVSKTSEAYRDNYDSIFRKKPQVCTRSHPHENMSEDCEELTEIAWEKYLKRIQEFKEYTLACMENK